MLQALRAANCSRIYVTDIDDTRLRLAEQLGATATINASKVDTAAEIQQLTSGIGVDVALEAVGNSATIKTAIDSVRKGGHGDIDRQHLAEGRDTVASGCQPADSPARFSSVIRRVSANASTC